MQYNLDDTTYKNFNTKEVNTKITILAMSYIKPLRRSYFRTPGITNYSAN